VTTDRDLWIRTAELVLQRGRSLVEALATADRVMLAYLRNRQGSRENDRASHLDLASASLRLEGG